MPICGPLQFIFVLVMDDLFYNAGGGTLYLRFNGHFYKRVVGQSWKQISETEAAEAVWSKLHEVQRNAYIPELKRQGLVNDPQS